MPQLLSGARIFQIPGILARQKARQTCEESRVHREQAREIMEQARKTILQSQRLLPRSAGNLDVPDRLLKVTTPVAFTSGDFAS